MRRVRKTEPAELSGIAPVESLTVRERAKIRKALDELRAQLDRFGAELEAFAERRAYRERIRSLEQDLDEARAQLADKRRKSQ